MSTLGNLRHLRMQGRVRTELYVSPNPGGGGTFQMPPRDRQEHGTRLLGQLEQAEAEAQATQERLPMPPAGINLRFRSDPAFELALKSLEVVSEGIELTCMTEEEERTVATVYVPNGKLTYFTRRFQEYLSTETKKGEPRHSRLVESIADVGLAAIEHFWTEREEQLPAEDKAIWWEVWLRSDNTLDVAMNVWRLVT
jgi:hypothetical protein